MDLNHHGLVVGVYGTNEDGEKLVEGYDARGKEKTTVADELIDRAIEMGFLSEGGQVSFSIDSPDDILFQEYGIELRSEVEEYLKGRMTITVAVFQGKYGYEANTSSSSTASASSSAVGQRMFSDVDGLSERRKILCKGKLSAVFRSFFP